MGLKFNLTNIDDLAVPLLVGGATRARVPYHWIQCYRRSSKETLSRA